ncbi:hypothetical protein COCCADRAFT_89389 [Bipolaris zeicola 26-R-13]|uniref:SMP domain-containing protein n=1 Tax=Cochliobolus carbonum (strain 26-R-13) TaxID=930089 RepID=W6YWX4_COCC2|nr:uncharacterized protein COCCADRAFT_89389 [Bipolaris zeicola 26-R-13]EUC36011.1 hypothetical protein COCCADRAFT_89389 [Bipolaris zeicola 26-R-13]
MFSDTSSLASSQSSQFKNLLEAMLEKLKTDPSSVTVDDARLLFDNFTASDERAVRIISAVEYLAIANKDLHDKVESSPGEVTIEVLRTTQSVVSKMQKALGHTNVPHPEVEGELQEEIAKIEPKIVQGTVTKAEADRLHSLESRAYGHTEKGGITAAAQSVVARRERQLSLSGGPKALQPSESEQPQPNKGSFTSPEQQSQHDKEENILQAADAVKDKIEEGTVTKEEAGHLQSLESRTHGDTIKGGIAATAQSTAARRESNASDAYPCADELAIRPKIQDNSKNTLSPQEQSHHDKEENLRQAELAIQPKIQDSTVTPAEANKLHSCEMRAHGHTEKGGLAATAQSVVSHRQRTLSDISNSPHPSETDAGPRKEDTAVNKEPKKVEGDLGDVRKAENEAQ